LIIEFSPLQRTEGLRPQQKRRGKEEFSKWSALKHSAHILARFQTRV